MRKYPFYLLAIFLVFLPVSIVHAVEIPQQALIVTFKEKPEQQVAAVQRKNKEIDKGQQINESTTLFYYHTVEEKNKIIQQLQTNKQVALIEEDAQRYTSSYVEEMNDPFFKQQWWITASKLNKAWQFQQAQHPVTVAVIDSGVDRAHLDLKNRLHTEGYNFYHNSRHPFDEKGHGTAVSGIIVAEANNYLGIAGAVGTSPVTVLPIRVTNENGVGYVSDMIKAVEYAIEQNVDIINISMGSEVYIEAERKVIQQAIKNGIVVIASSGNEALKGNKMSYPAAYPEVISVGALTKSNTIARFSTFNSEVNLVAPGESIATTGLNQSYVSVSGTSFAAPIVTGVAALLKSEYPLATVGEIREAIESTTIDLGPLGRDPQFGTGAVHAERALAYFQQQQLADLSILPKLTQLSFSEELTSLSNLGITVEPSFYAKTITRAEFVELLARVLELEPQRPSSRFKDINHSNNVSYYLDEMIKKKIIQGYPDGTFQPQQPLTRAHAAALLDRAFQLQATPEVVTFTDMTERQTAYSSIQKLAQHRIATGFPDGSFKPHLSLSYRHALTFLARAYRISQ